MPKLPREDGPRRPKRAKAPPKGRKTSPAKKKKTSASPASGPERRPTIMPSQSVDHGTPFRVLKGIVYPVLGEPVDLDPCSNPQSIVQARRCVMLPENGLEIPWRGKVYVNPPYGMPDILEWIRKCVIENRHHGAEIVALLPANTSAEWFDIVAATARACFFYGPGLGGRRIRFIGNVNNAAFHSAFVYWGPNLHTFTEAALRYCHPWYPEHDLRLARALVGDVRLPEGASTSIAAADQLLTLSRNDDLVSALTALGSATLGDILDAGKTALLARLRQVCAYELGAALLYASRTDSKAWVDHRIPGHPRKLDPRQLDLALSGRTEDGQPPVAAPPSVEGPKTLDEIIYAEIRKGTVLGDPPTAQDLKDRCVCSQGQLRGVITRLRREKKVKITGRTQGARYIAVGEEGNPSHAAR